MRAMMSTGTERHSYEAYVVGVGRNNPYLAAVLEAERILGETERRQTMFGGHSVAFPVSLGLLNRDYLDDGADEAIALAEGIARAIEVMEGL